MTIFTLLLIFQKADKTYFKSFFYNNNIKEEGWILKSQKTDYWFFYYENGTKKAEGHYLNDKKCKWWIFYNEKEEIIKKSEYKNDLLNGFSIIYKNNNIIKAEKYLDGKKIKEWTSMKAFKKDNHR